MVELNIIIQEIFKLLRVSLEEEKAEILIKRYLRDMTLQEIADESGVTRERIRQKEAKSIIYCYDLLKFRGYKNDLDLVLKRASSKLQILSNSLDGFAEDSFIEKYNFILKISTKFPDSDYKIEKSRYFKNYIYMNKDINLDDLIDDFRHFYRNDKSNLITNINQKYNLNIDEKFLQNFIDLTQLNEDSQLLLNFKIKNFESNRMDKIEKFLKDRGREATVQEICEALKVEERSVRSALDLTDKVVNIGKSVYGHVDNGYKQGTTQDLILEYIKLNSPVSVFKIQRYIKNERVVKESSVTMYLMDLKKKGLVEKIDDEYHFIKDIKNLDDSDTKIKKPVIKKEPLNPFKELFRFKINEHKEIIVSEARDFIRIGDYVKSNKYEGLTKSGVVIKKNQIDVFLDNVNKTLNTGLQTSIPWNNMENTELLIRKEEKIPSSGSYYIDLRQFIKSKNFEGFTKKGIRIDEKVFRDFFEELKSRKDFLRTKGD